jgi:fructose-1,6-bisphosphatase I
MEQAGGKASNGSQRILELGAHKLHQRTPIFIGSSHLVERVETLIQERVLNVEL